MANSKQLTGLAAGALLTLGCLAPPAPAQAPAKPDDTIRMPAPKKADENPPTAKCCKRAPPVLEFDQQGNLLRSWGGPGQGYEWPESNHGIFVDHKGIVWIGGNGTNDAQVLKFTQDGKFIAQYGHSGKTAGSNDKENFGRIAKIFVDAKANEAYLADGYLNKRLAVLDADTGAFKRYWGAYGNKPDDTSLGTYDPDAPVAQQFRNPVHCADPSVDGLVYVCDRPNNRIQVFTTEGKFVKEQIIAKRTRGDGSDSVTPVPSVTRLIKIGSSSRPWLATAAVAIASWSVVTLIPCPNEAAAVSTWTHGRPRGRSTPTDSPGSGTPVRSPKPNRRKPS